MSEKIFVLDTNVILHNPKAFYQFEENEVVLPFYVIEEVDHFKKEMNELGRNARTISRMIDELRDEALGSGGLQGGVKLSSGGTLRVAVPSSCLTESSTGSMDLRILQVALAEKNTHPLKQVILISMDINMRIRADALGLKAENYEIAGVQNKDDAYSGIQEFTVHEDWVNALGKKTSLDDCVLGAEGSLTPNTGIVLINEGNPKHTALGRYDARSKQIVPLRLPREGISGIKPKNLEQSFALDLLLNDNIQLVSLIGKAGTGKTLLAVAAGLHKVLREGAYSRLLLARPVFGMGKEIGFLPGTMEEKILPFMLPLYEAIELILSTSGGRMDTGRSLSELLASQIIEILPITFIRGRSLPNQFIIIDEAQNLNQLELKTIITRAGEGTKIILTGDNFQIDNNSVDSQSNGISLTAERFKNETLAGHVTLKKGERSELAETASRLL